MFLWSKLGLVRMADNLTAPSVSRLCRQCGILNIPQSYRSPRHVTEIALLFTFTFIFYLKLIHIKLNGL
jgi:hypothetical protein